MFAATENSRSRGARLVVDQVVEPSGELRVRDKVARDRTLFILDAAIVVLERVFVTLHRRGDGRFDRADPQAVDRSTTEPNRYTTNRFGPMLPAQGVTNAIVPRISRLSHVRSAGKARGCFMDFGCPL
jgi:hypothetical protein